MRHRSVLLFFAGLVLSIGFAVSSASALRCKGLFDEAKTKFNALSKEGKLDADRMIEVNDLMTEGISLCKEQKDDAAVAKLEKALGLLRKAGT